MLTRNRSLFVFKLCVAVAALAYVIWLVDWRQATAVLAQGDLYWLGLAFSALLAGFFPAALRWVCLLREVGISYRGTSAYRAYLTGAFYGLAMPGVIGGDAARVLVCLRETEAPLTLVGATVLVERTLGVAALFMILSVGVSLFPLSGNWSFLEWVPPIAIVCGLGVGCLSFILRRVSFAKCNVSSRGTGKWSNQLRSLSKQLSPIKRLSALSLFASLGLSVVFQFFDVLATYAIGQALSIDVSLSILLIGMPIVYLVTVLPISPGGLGIREAALVIILSQFGLSPSEAAILAVAVFLNRVAIGLVGAAQHLASGKGTDSNRGRCSKRKA